MLLYRKDGTLYCVTKKALQLAGYQSLGDFLAQHKDYSELFVKKPGYIYNFENFSWINFLKHATPQQKKALLRDKEGNLYQCNIEIETYLPLEAEGGTAAELYQISLSNATPVDEAGAILDESIPSTFTQPDRNLTEDEPQASPVVEDLSGDLSTSEAPAFDISLQIDEAPEEKEPTPAPKDEPVNFIDFGLQEEPDTKSATSFDETEEKTQEEPLAIEPLDLDIGLKTDEAFDGIPPEPSTQLKVESHENAEEEPFPVSQIDIETEIHRISEITGLPSQSIRSFVEEFFKEGERHIEAMRSAFAADDSQKLRKEALLLKGVAANLHFESIEKTCERILKSDDKQTVQSAIDTLATLFGLTQSQSATTSTTDDETAMTIDLPILDEETVSSQTEEIQPIVPPSSAESDNVPNEENMEEEVPFDPKAAAEALGLPTDLIVEFTEDFIRQCDEEKERFSTALAQNDITSINEAAHKLKGVAANLRIDLLKELLEKIQYTQTTADAEPLIAELYKKVSILRNQLKEST